MSKRVLAMALAILAFFIFVGSPFQQSAKAVALVDDAIIAIIIAGLAAMGITFVTTGAFDTLEEYVESLLGEFAQYHGTTVGILTSGLQSGTNKLGQILINNRFVVLIDTFGKWLKAKFSLLNNSQVQAVVPGSTLDGMLVYVTPFTFPSSNSNYYSTIVYSDDGTPVNALISQNDNIGFYIYFFSDHQTGINITYVYHNQPTSYHYDLQSYDSLYPNCKYYTYRAGTTYDYVNTSAFTKYPNQQIRDALNADYNVIVNDTGIVINTDNMVLPTDDSNYTEGDGAIIDVGAEWGDSYSDVIDDTIPDEFSDSKEGSASIEYVSEDEVADDVDDTVQSSVSQEVSDYQSPGLQSVFPFCIPFDIYAFFECLAAEPEAPSFVWRFYIPGICDEDLEIDLAAFDSAARILRTMELLLFIVGLAFVTRDKFLRG